MNKETKRILLNQRMIMKALSMKSDNTKTTCDLVASVKDTEDLLKSSNNKEKENYEKETDKIFALKQEQVKNGK